MSNQITPNPSVPSQVVAEVKFPRWINNLGIIPTSYKDSMSYYECLAWLCKFLEETVIPSVNENGEATQELQNLYVELNSYVTHYFETLDVQEEINNKLDDMVEDGTLPEIVADYLNSKAVFGFDTVADMKAGTNLINGSYAKTLGFYSKNDKGSGLYKIEENLTPNEMNIISLNNGLFARLIENSLEVNAKQYGVHCDGNTNDTLILQNVINYCKNSNRSLKIIGYCYVTDSIDTKGILIKGEGERPYPKQTYYSHQYGDIQWDYLRNINNGALITFDDYKIDVLTSGSGIISDVANPVLICHSHDGNFKLENISIVGWLRNSTQVGLKTVYDSTDQYIYGKHYFNKLSVFNFGSNGIELDSLELSDINNCDFSLNFGYGLYIKENSEIDCPFEYDTFNQCYFRCNKLGGLYAKNCFRKSVIFNDCFINRNGLYDQLGITPPSNFDDLVAGITIDGRSQYDPLIHDQRILTLNNCHGEEQNLLIKIDSYGEGYVFNNITIKECSNYPSQNTVVNAVAYINTYYTKTLNFYNNYLNSNLDQLVLSSESYQKIIPGIVDSVFYKVYNNNPNVTVNSKITVSRSSQYKFGNLVFINVLGTANTDIPAWEKLLTNMPVPLSLWHPDFNIGNSVIRGAAYVDGGCSIGSQITNGTEININLVYFVAYQS